MKERELFNLRLIPTSRYRYSSFENVNFLTNQHCILDKFAIDITQIFAFKRTLIGVVYYSFVCAEARYRIEFEFWFQKDEVFLNLVLEYVPETVYRVARHYSKSKQTIPVLYIKVRTAMWQTRFPNIIFIQNICKYCRSRNIRWGFNFVIFVGSINQRNYIHDEFLTQELINTELIRNTFQRLW